MSSTSESATAAAAASSAPRSFARRDRLRAIESTAQARWAASKAFEVDAPLPGAPVPAGGKFMTTFPYPYMNGRLHLGHAFTVSKAEFAAGYHALKGKPVLFPFGFHCTGMPIQAAANKLRRELETGSHLAAAAAPADEADDGVEGGATNGASAAGAEAPAPADAPAAPAAKLDPSKFSGKKSKAVAKSGGPGLSQYAILLKSGIPEAEVPRFVDPAYWLEYFPPLGKVRDRALARAHTPAGRCILLADPHPLLFFLPASSCSAISLALAATSTGGDPSLRRRPIRTTTRLCVGSSTRCARAASWALASGRRFSRRWTASRAWTTTGRRARPWACRSTR